MSLCPYLNQQDEANKCGGAGKEMHYRNYLGLDTLLSLQRAEKKSKKHDEFLFITTHQVHELWFQQVIYEVDSVKALLSSTDKRLPVCLDRLNRVALIFDINIKQFSILESMRPLEFMEFREHLFPASGLQSHQFRIIENKLGLRPKNRINIDNKNYKEAWEKNHPDLVERFNETEKEKSLFEAVDSWLAEIFRENADEGDKFWKVYTKCVRDDMAKDPTKEILTLKFGALLDEDQYKREVAADVRRISFLGLKGALLVAHYKHEPKFSDAGRILSQLVDIDVLLSKFRFGHLMTVEKAIGTNTTGTGNTSGYAYLASTLDQRLKIFLEISNLAGLLKTRELLLKTAGEMDLTLNLSTQGDEQ